MFVQLGNNGRTVSGWNLFVVLSMLSLHITLLAFLEMKRELKRELKASTSKNGSSSGQRAILKATNPAANTTDAGVSN